MGSCSNRKPTKAEEIGILAKKVAECRDTSDWRWQMRIGAEIRGKLGIEKGNKFIKSIREVT